MLDERVSNILLWLDDQISCPAYRLATPKCQDVYHTPTPGQDVLLPAVDSLDCRDYPNDVNYCLTPRPSSRWDPGHVFLTPLELDRRPETDA